MSDETIESLKAQIRGLSSERDRYKADASSWQTKATEASSQIATLQGQVTNLTPFQEQVSALKADIQRTNTRADQEVALAGMGITSTRARRLIRREYTSEVADLADGAEAPKFGAFVETLKADTFFGNLFSGTATEPAKPKEKEKRRPAADPNGGTTTPREPEKALDLASYNERRNRIGIGAARASLEQLKKQGIIS